MRHTLFTLKNIVGRIFFAAFVTVVAQCGAVDLIDLSVQLFCGGSVGRHLVHGFLMKTVDVLCDDAVELSLQHHFSELFVGSVRFDAFCVHFLTIEFVEHIGMCVETVVGQEIFGRIGVEADIVLIVQAVFRAEIGDAAFCGYTCAAEEDDVTRVCDHFVESFVFFLFAERLQIFFLFTTTEFIDILHGILPPPYICIQDHPAGYPGSASSLQV